MEDWVRTWGGKSVRVPRRVPVGMTVVGPAAVALGNRDMGGGNHIAIDRRSINSHREKDVVTFWSLHPEGVGKMEGGPSRGRRKSHAAEGGGDTFCFFNWGAGHSLDGEVRFTDTAEEPCVEDDS